MTDADVKTKGNAIIGKTMTEFVMNAITDNVTVRPSIPVSPI
jgi:hypothetical protein